MTILELKEQRLGYQNEFNTLIQNAETEKREMNETESARMAELRSLIDKVDEQIKAQEAENQQLARQCNNKPKTKQRMKLTTLINKVIEGRAFTEDEAKYIQEARAEMGKSGINPVGQIAVRTINASTATQGQETVAEDKLPLDISARNALVASQMGATYLSNLVGDVSLPKYNGTSVTWKGETAAAEDGEGAFSEIILKPHRLTAKVTVSKQFLAQNSDDVEAALIRDINAAVAEKLDSTIFAGVSGVTDAPKPISNTQGIVSKEISSSATYADVLAMEQAVEEANGNTNEIAFVCSPSVKFAYKGTQLGNGMPFMYANDEIDGYPAFVSNSVKKNDVYCLVPRDLYIGEWGGLDVTVDNVTKADEGCVRLIINGYYDFAYKSKKIAKTSYTA